MLCQVLEQLAPDVSSLNPAHLCGVEFDARQLVVEFEFDHVLESMPPADPPSFDLHGRDRRRTPL